MRNLPFPELFFAFLAVLLSSCSTSKPLLKENALVDVIDQNIADAVVQYKTMMVELLEGMFPKAYFPATNKFETSRSDWWCSGFYPGSLFMLYKETGDTKLFTEGKRMLQLLEKEKNNRGTHDLGFMMYCSFGNANKIENNKQYEDILLTSARSLSTRFNPLVGCIKSWDSKPSDFLVIIDNMMNLELLFWATHYSHDSSFYKIAVTHANTTMKNHFRPDHSSFHVVNYDPTTGEVKEKKTAQGFSDSSAWARGQSWGLYGFTVMYRETKDKKYLEQATGIADFLIHHANLPDDKIPYWDYNAVNIPNAERDASAAAIMASALLELSSYTDKQKSEEYFATADKILRNLSSPEFKAAVGTNGGFLLKHSTGHYPAKSEVDVGITYADYYFLEAMMRYKKLAGGDEKVALLLKK